MNVQSFSRKPIYKVLFFLLLIGIMLSSMGRISTASAQDLAVGGFGLSNFIHAKSQHLLENNIISPTPTLLQNLPFKIHAPWRAGLTLRAGGYGGDFYGDCNPGYHCGSDFYAIDFNGEDHSDDGEIVVAVTDGVINFDDYGTCLDADSQNHCGGYGNTVVIEHGSGIRTRYAHLDQVYIARYAPTYHVNQGDPIGTIGMTGGTSTGKHLHFVGYQFPIIEGSNPFNYTFSTTPYQIPPEPMEGFSPIIENLEIRSKNYRVGYVVDWSTQFPAITKIYEKYGGRWFVFGLTKTPVLIWGGSAGGPAFQEFSPQDIRGYPWSNLGDSGIMTSADQKSAYLICAPIWDKYLVDESGPSGWLGLPTQDCIDWEKDGRKGYRSDFMHGYIIWWADTQSFVIDDYGNTVGASGTYPIPPPLVYADGPNPPHPSVGLPTTPPPTTPPPGKWHAQYFSDHNWSTQKCVRDLNGSGLVGADFYEDWGASAPCIGMPTDNFSVRYTGSFSFGLAGTYWFKTHHDDGATIRIDGNVFQNWSSSGDECPAITLSSGTHTLRIDYQENTGGASVGLEVRNSPCPVPTTPDPKQWHAQYFSDHNWSSLQCERYFDGTGPLRVDFSENWDGGAPCNNMPTDNFSVRYTATVSIGSTAVYWFHVNHDDTARLTIDGEDLQNWTQSGDDCPARTLTAGSHTFRIDYRENTGSAHISLNLETSLCFPPGSSAKISPTNGAIDQPTNNLTLRWEPNSGASSYEYCYDTVNDNACSSWISAGTNTSANLSALIPNTTYYWQVRSTNKRGSTETDMNTWWSFRTASVSGSSVSATVNPPLVKAGDTATVVARLNNVPAEGYSGAEFTCTYENAGVTRSSSEVGNIFGTDPVLVESIAPSSPGSTSFIVAIAGSNGKKATTSGPAFTFDLTIQQLMPGQISIECQARVSKGDGILVPLPSMGPGTLTINGATVTPTDTPTPTFTSTETPTPTVTSTGTATPTATPTPTSTATPTATTQPPGTLTGRVIACKQVTVDLRNASLQLVTTAIANSDGRFTVTVPAGEYIVEADAKGFLWTRTADPVMISSGEITTLATITLLPGDIFKIDILIQAVIDEWDAMTIGMNYNGATPTDGDLNCDGIINVLDLELLAKNYRKTGPIAWQ
jgi:hypothetical protein